MALTKGMLEKLTDRSPDIVVGTDRKGRVIYYNDGATKSLGYRSEEVLGTFVGHVYPSIEEARRVSQAMRSDEHGGPGIVETFRTTFLAKSGEQIPVAISGTLLFDEKGDEDRHASVTRRICARSCGRTSSPRSARWPSVSRTRSTIPSP